MQNYSRDPKFSRLYAYAHQPNHDAPPIREGRLAIERLRLDLYLITTSTPSRINKTASIETRNTMRCPHCNRVQPAVQHGDARECEGCGLKMLSYGNALYCELTLPVVETSKAVH